MEILELRERKPADNGHLDKTDFMNLRRLQPREKLANAKASLASQSQSGVENLIRGLVELLPKQDGIWTVDDRAKWLRLAADIFDIGYKAGDSERRAINITVAEATND
jgi:hypothetical protein